jgi:hypothetical protein
MLHLHLSDALRDSGFTEAQVTTMMRDGGPMDSIRHRTWCDGCGRSRECTLRDLLDGDCLCTCGKTFHIPPKTLVAEIVTRLVP